MRYAQIRSMDISNGRGIGASLFVQGCDNKCKGCFNEETWDFDSGNEWTDDIRHEFVDMVKKYKRKRVSILGGEPLDLRNVRDVLDLILELKEEISDIEIWVYTGYTINWIIEKFVSDPAKYIYLAGVINSIDVLVDGPFILDKKDFSLKFRGSSNQRVIEISKCAKLLIEDSQINKLSTKDIDNIITEFLLYT